MSDHYTCKRCLSHFSECECPSHNEYLSWATIKDDPNVLGLVKRGEKGQEDAGARNARVGLG